MIVIADTSPLNYLIQIECESSRRGLVNGSEVYRRLVSSTNFRSDTELERDFFSLIGQG